MKFTPEVVAALEVLRAAAENDFERHRLDVLERDLHEPPKVEQIDDTHQRFDGTKYNKSAKGFFSRNASIHRVVWAYFNGEIPEGYDIHHVDGNKGNNNIENLQCMTAGDHQRLHIARGEKFPTKKKRFVCEVCGKEFYTVDRNVQRYCSPHCRDVSRYHREMTSKTCEWCGKVFETAHPESRFCSPACGAQSRYQNALIKKICPVCGKEFERVKSEQSETCSLSCRTRLMWQRRREAKS